MPLTLRIAFHSLRCGWLAVMITLAAWLGLAAATPEERAALGAQIGDERPQGLVQMRVARAMVHFAPDRAAAFLSEASDGEISPELAGMMLRHLAAGPAAQQAAFDAMVADGGQTSTARRVGGAKFVPAN
ncbi:hypothetical protein [Yoonia sp. 2307UL14-13]|uniref:hypothetical protein n=1 Tax=Yoonia sp. 2307UL14-13 TaxID=3126506 RepID=UPI003097C89C